MTDLLSLPNFAPGTNVHVVVETPRHAQAKFKHDRKLRAFTPSRALTLGLTYPYDWGFVPSTAAADGDPIDAVVLHNVTTSPGMVLRCKPLGILDVPQTEKQRTERNDRLMMVPLKSTFQPGIRAVHDLSASLRHQAEEFFVAATAGTGKTLKFLGWRGPRAAMAAIRRAQKAFERRTQSGPRR